MDPGLVRPGCDPVALTARLLRALDSVSLVLNFLVF